MLNAKIADHHLARQACIYIRQSTMAQVRLNQESTERQYISPTKRSRSAVLDHLIRRGLRRPEFLIVDGAPG